VIRGRTPEGNLRPDLWHGGLLTLLKIPSLRVQLDKEMSVDEHQRAHLAQLELLDELRLKAVEHTQAYQKRAQIYKKTILFFFLLVLYWIPSGMSDWKDSAFLNPLNLLFNQLLRLLVNFFMIPRQNTNLLQESHVGTDPSRMLWYQKESRELWNELNGWLLPNKKKKSFSKYDYDSLHPFFMVILFFSLALLFLPLSLVK